jgi:hypothetical protein
VYLFHWLSAPLTAEAPLNDIILEKDLETWEQLFPHKTDLVTALQAKSKAHTWYNHPKLVASLFDPRIDDDQK